MRTKTAGLLLVAVILSAAITAAVVSSTQPSTTILKTQTISVPTTVTEFLTKTQTESLTETPTTVVIQPGTTTTETTTTSQTETTTNKTTTTTATTEQEFKYCGSINSDVYHYPWCSYAKKIKPENLIWFTDEYDAKSKGYRPCKVCNPPG